MAQRRRLLVAGSEALYWDTLATLTAQRHEVRFCGEEDVAPLVETWRPEVILADVTVSDTSKDTLKELPAGTPEGLPLDILMTSPWAKSPGEGPRLVLR